MAVDTVTDVNNSDDAHFRAWAQAIHDVLEAGGWMQTADTGQIDLSTASAPGGIDTKVGYEIWTSNDAADDIVDIYIKIFYGSGSSGSGVVPSIWLSAGWESDGAGNLGSVHTTETRAYPTGGALDTAGALDICAGPGFLLLFLIDRVVAGGDRNFLLSLERTRDTAAEFQNQVHVFAKAGGASWFSQCTTPTRVYTDQTGLYQSVMPANNTTPIAGQVALGLIFGMAVGPTSPSINVLGVEETSLGLDGDIVTVDLYGDGHTFKVHSNGVSTTFPFMTATGVNLTRYE